MSFDLFDKAPAELDPNVVDDQLIPGLRPPPQGVETINDTANTKDGEVPFTAHKWSEIAVIDNAIWTPGNPDDPASEYDHEKFRLRLKITDDSTNHNKNRFIEMQFMDFYMSLVPREWDDLRKEKEGAEKGDIRRRLGAMKFETHANIKKMTQLLRATGYSDRLSPSRRLFYGFHTIMDLINENTGLQNIPILVTIEKGRPAYNGKLQELVVAYEAL